MRVANSAEASNKWPRNQACGDGVVNASTSGSTIAAPVKSPSHQVRHTSDSPSAEMTSPRRRDRDPTVALTTVPAASATSRPPTPATLSSGEARGLSRRSRSTATSTSSRLPVVCPSAGPSGSVQ